MNHWTRGQLGIAAALVLIVLGGHGPAPGSTTSLADSSTAATLETQPLWAISCPSVTICYAGGDQGTILTTHDVGRTWQPQDTGTGDGVQVIDCPAASVCLTADGDAEVPPKQCDGRTPPFGAIFRTQDGGQDWRQVYVRRDRDYLVGPIVCPSVTVCYVPGVTRQDRPRNEFVLSTKDGGQTWSKHMVPADRALDCPNITVCYIAAHTRATFFVTDDGGTTWRMLRQR